MPSMFDKLDKGGGGSAAVATSMLAMFKTLLGWARSGIGALWAFIGAFIATEWQAWKKSLGATFVKWFVDEKDPDQAKLLDFIALLDGRASKFEADIKEKIETQYKKAQAARDEYLARFDRGADKLHEKHPIIFNETYRDSLRSRLQGHLDKAIDKGRNRALEEAQLAISEMAAEAAKMKLRATNIVQKAEAKRAEIEALRTPGLNGRSREQLKKLLKNIEDGDSRSQWTREQIENQIKAMDMKGH